MSIFKQEQHKQENERPRQLVPHKKERTWKDIAKVAAMIVLAPLAIVGLLSGCGPAPQTRSENDSEQVKELVWFPASMLKRGNHGFKSEDVSLGVPTSDWAGLPGSYPSVKKIPLEVRESYRKDIEEIVIPTIIEKFNTANPDFVALLENNIFAIFSVEGMEGDMPSYYHMGAAYSIVDVQGYDIAVCDQSYCTEYNILRYKKEELVPGSEVFAMRTIVHELLHDVFLTGLSEAEQAEFVETLKQFLRNFELDEQSLRKMLDIERAQYSVRADEVDDYLVSREGDTIDLMRKFRVDFIRERYPGLSTEERQKLNNAISSIESLQINVSDLTLGPTSTLNEYRDRYANLGIVGPEQQRETFLSGEGYPYIIELDIIPENLLKFYEPYMMTTFLSQKTSLHSFSSWKELEEHLPLFKEFIRYTIQRYESGDY